MWTMTNAAKGIQSQNSELDVATVDTENPS
jgi:hypothetical protein